MRRKAAGSALININNPALRIGGVFEPTDAGESSTGQLIARVAGERFFGVNADAATDNDME
jgi:hypothetical protein